MQLLYEEAAKTGLRPDTGPSWDSERGSVPLPILLRVPRFAIREKAPAPLQSALDRPVPTAELSAPERLRRARTSGRTAKRHKTIILGALMLAVVSVGIVSQNPRLLERLLQRQSGLVQSRDPHERETSVNLSMSGVINGTAADSVIRQNRSAWLQPEIFPLNPENGSEPH
jgi:hypothetical protein